MDLRSVLPGHEPIFGRTTVFYTFVFDVGTDIPFDIVAERLLKSGIAESVVSSTDQQPRVAPHISQLADVKEDAKSLIDAERLLKRELKWGQTSWKARTMAARILANAASSVAFRRHRDTGDTGTPSDLRIESDLTETIDEIDQSVTNRLLQTAIHSHVDNVLYQTGYLETNPYVRLELRPCGIRYQNSPQPDSSDPDEFYDDWVHPTVLLHRSGVALLTIGLRLPDALSLEELLPMLSARGVVLTGFIFPEPVIETVRRFVGARRDDVVGTWHNEPGEGVRWLDSRSLEDASLVEVFWLYQDAIFSFSGTLPGRQDWFCYPTTFIERLDCCGSRRRWTRRHSETLGSLAARTDFRGRITSETLRGILSPDLALTKEETLLIPGGMTTVVHWIFDDNTEILFGDYLMRLTVTENAMLQYWQLVALDNKISESGGTLKDLVRLQRTAIYGLAELQRSQLTYGTASDISKRTFDTFGGSELQERVRSRLADTQQFIATQEAVKGSRRANRFALAAVVAALLLGLPAIKQSIEVIRNARASSQMDKSWWSAIVGQSPDSLALATYLAAISLVLIGLLVGRLSILARRRERQRHISEVGQPWSGPEIRVRFEDDAAHKSRRRIGSLLASFKRSLARRE